MKFLLIMKGIGRVLKIFGGLILFGLVYLILFVFLKKDNKIMQAIEKKFNTNELMINQAKKRIRDRALEEDRIKREKEAELDKIHKMDDRDLDDYISRHI